MLSHLYYVLTDVLSRLLADLIAKLFEGRCYFPMLEVENPIVIANLD